MFSIDGRNVKRILINGFVNNSSHFAGCPAINANEFWTLAITFIYFSKSHFLSYSRLPKLHCALLPARWRFRMPPDWCSLRICKIFFVCQLLCSFDPPICIWYITQQESFSVSSNAGVQSFCESSHTRSCKLALRSKSEKLSFFLKTTKNHNVCT